MTAPLFDPATARLVRPPAGDGPGYWAGAPGVYRDPADGHVWLTYRLRGPRPQRGGITCLAVSDDGLTFTEVTACRKEQLGSQSIERCAIRRDAAGWCWYLSYVDPDTGQWQIDLVEAASPETLDPARRRKLLVADDLQGIEGVKDPYPFEHDGRIYLLASIALRLDLPPEREAEQHATGDIFNTGLTVSSTGLAVSDDGRSFTWLGVTDAARGRWDRYCFRVNCLLRDGDRWLALYDGSASVAENYEERCGLAVTRDLLSYERVSRDGPAITVPRGSGSVRYVDCVEVDGRRLFYHEVTRPDGAHELRVAEG